MAYHPILAVDIDIVAILQKSTQADRRRRESIHRKGLQTDSSSAPAVDSRECKSSNAEIVAVAQRMAVVATSCDRLDLTPRVKGRPPLRDRRSGDPPQTPGADENRLALCGGF